MLKTEFGKSFVFNHLEILLELICDELDAKLSIKVCFFRHALSLCHPVIDSKYFEKSKLLFKAVDLLPQLNFWDMYVLAIISLKSGWWNISTCFLQTLSSQNNLSSKTLEWLLFLKGYSEEEEALVSLPREEVDCESMIETLDFMTESELPSNLPFYHSNVLTSRRFLLGICKSLLKSYMSELEMELLIPQMASSIKNLRDITRTWAFLGYENIRKACDSFLSILLGGRTLNEFESELDPCPQVISVIETLDYKVIEFLFSFTWQLNLKFFQGL